MIHGLRCVLWSALVGGALGGCRGVDTTAHADARVAPQRKPEFAAAFPGARRAGAASSSDGRAAAAPLASVVAASSSVSAEGPASPCPPEMARVEPEGAPPFCIDRWEAHLVVVDGTAEAPHPHSHRPAEAQRYFARSAPGVFPQAYINRPEASAACEAAGKRLCSLGEWYRACEGSKRTVYPYGPKREKGRCNASKPHLLTKLYGSDSRGWRYDEHFNNPELNEVPGFLARTGEYSGCVSEAGVFDLVGNLHEWVADSVDSSLPRKLPLRDDIAGKIGKNRGHGIFMGGFFSTTSEHGEGCRFLTPGHEPKYHDYSTGFRCCADGLR